MLDFGNFPSATKADVQTFGANSTAVNVGWATWTKPRGISMVHIVGIGAAGGGGDAVAGAASTAAGGGGGGSGGLTVVMMPAILLPDTLFLSVAKGNPNNTSTSAAASYSTRVAVYPDATANNCVLIVNGGASGGKSNGATAGPVGTAAAIATNATMPIGWTFSTLALAGQVGIIGGTTGNANALTLPTTGLLVTGGTGGGGVGAAGAAGGNGGAITAAGVMGGATGGAGGAAGGANPGGTGWSGTCPFKTLGYWLGGTGGGASGLSGTPTGSTGGNGGRGATGSGGGGGGGAFTGQQFGLGGYGGDSLVIITSW